MPHGAETVEHEHEFDGIPGADYISRDWYGIDDRGEGARQRISAWWSTHPLRPQQAVRDDWGHPVICWPRPCPDPACPWRNPNL